MTTQARIIANCLNAQKSTGPKTAQGKAIVSQNALKHGLSARHDVIITESQEDFDLHRDSLLEELAPQTPTESMLADRLISLSWRLKRADRIQNQTFDAMDEENKSNPFPNLTKTLARKNLYRPDPQTADHQHDLTLGRIALKDFSNERLLDRLLMYERRIENSLHKTLLELQRLTLIRNLEPKPQQARSVSAGVPAKPKPSPAPNKRKSWNEVEIPIHRRRSEPTTTNPRLASGPVPEVTKEKNKTTTPKTTYDIPHTTYEFVKQTQSPKPKKQPNPLHHKALQQNTAPPPQEKTNPIKPNPAEPDSPRDTQYEIKTQFIAAKTYII